MLGQQILFLKHDTDSERFPYIEVENYYSNISKIINQSPIKIPEIQLISHFRPTLVSIQRIYQVVHNSPSLACSWNSRLGFSVAFVKPKSLPGFERQAWYFSVQKSRRFQPRFAKNFLVVWRNFCAFCRVLSCYVRRTKSIVTSIEALGRTVLSCPIVRLSVTFVRLSVCLSFLSVCPSVRESDRPSGVLTRLFISNVVHKAGSKMCPENLGHFNELSLIHEELIFFRETSCTCNVILTLW